MRDYYLKLFEQYKNQGIIVDANLLLLYFIGSYDNRRIGGKKLQIMKRRKNTWFLQTNSLCLAIYKALALTP